MSKMLEAILITFYSVLAGVLGLAVWRLRLALHRFTMRTKMTSAKVVKHQPSVTVCIPARNENHAMTDCLHRVIASTYEKLEVIVLDDLSGDNTSALIKSFAHEGVRFVEGSELGEGWLGKNHALQALLKEASGTYILYLDVDTSLAPDAISQLVAYAEEENADMVSVLPRREDGPRASVLFSTLRYFWEIMFHRSAAPATASNAWLINRRVLTDEFGGFESFKGDVQPEAKLSAALMAQGKYRFLIGSKQLGVGFEKKWRSQLATSLRLLFPLLGGKMPHAVIVFLDLLIIASLAIVLIVLVVLQQWLFAAIGAVLYLGFAVLYATYLSRVWNKGVVIGSVFWGLIALQEAALVAASTIQYARHAVTWKGRLVRISKR